MGDIQRGLIRHLVIAPRWLRPEKDDGVSLTPSTLNNYEVLNTHGWTLSSQCTEFLYTCCVLLECSSLITTTTLSGLTIPGP